MLLRQNLHHQMSSQISDVAAAETVLDMCRTCVLRNRGCLHTAQDCKRHAVLASVYVGHSDQVTYW